MKFEKCSFLKIQIVKSIGCEWLYLDSHSFILHLCWGSKHIWRLSDDF